MNAKKTIITILTLASFSFLASCGGTKPNEPSMISEPSPQYTYVTLMEEKDNKLKQYTLKDGIKKALTDSDIITDFQYSLNGNTIAYEKILSNGQELSHNKIYVSKDHKTREIKNFYSALDISLSPMGNKIAYRAFSKDSYDSAKGVLLYDIDKGKEIKFNTDTLISGNMYAWLNEKSIAYYGVSGNQNRIFKYDLDEKKESEILSIKNGHVTYLKPLNEKEIFTLRSDGDSHELFIYDISLKKEKFISEDIEKIYSVAAKDKDIYFICKDKDGVVSLYSINEDLKLNREIYDFPKNVNESGGIGIDEKGNVYFLGYEVNENLSEVYMIKKEDLSINIITEKPSNYHIYSRSY